MPLAKASRQPPASPVPLRCQQCAARPQCPIGQLPLPLQRQLAPWTTERGFNKGDTLLSEGVSTQTVHVIKLGTAMLTRQGPDGLARPVGIAGRGQLLGAWHLLDQPHQTGAIAMSAGRVCELPVQALAGPLSPETAWRQELHKSMANAYAALADWGHVMRLRGLPRQLVAALVLLGRAQGAAAVRLPSHVALASLLNTSRESVARTLRRLQTSGALHRIDRWHAQLQPGHRSVFADAPTER